MARPNFQIDDKSWELFKLKAAEQGTDATNLFRIFVEAVNADLIRLGFLSVGNIEKLKQSKGEGQATTDTVQSE